MEKKHQKLINVKTKTFFFGLWVLILCLVIIACVKTGSRNDTNSKNLSRQKKDGLLDMLIKGLLYKFSQHTVTDIPGNTTQEYLDDNNYPEIVFLDDRNITNKQNNKSFDYSGQTTGAQDTEAQPVCVKDDFNLRDLCKDVSLDSLTYRQVIKTFCDADIANHWAACYPGQWCEPGQGNVTKITLQRANNWLQGLGNETCKNLKCVQQVSETEVCKSEMRQYMADEMEFLCSLKLHNTKEDRACLADILYTLHMNMGDMMRKSDGKNMKELCNYDFQKGLVTKDCLQAYHKLNCLTVRCKNCIENIRKFQPWYWFFNNFEILSEIFHLNLTKCDTDPIITIKTHKSATDKMHEPKMESDKKVEDEKTENYNNRSKKIFNISHINKYKHISTQERYVGATVVAGIIFMSLMVTVGVVIWKRYRRYSHYERDDIKYSEVTGLITEAES